MENTTDATKSAVITGDLEQVKQFREFLTSYNKLSELCFVDCVWDFTTRKLRDNEYFKEGGGQERCATNCTEKFLKMNQRISQRFQEFQMVSNENAMAAVQKLEAK
ncbi:hypothetical protein B566_EDAN005466 [Ephemera danica]|nr:hypothetical protein B566_EDAN005466 [Ephemera danica]